MMDQLAYNTMNCDDVKQVSRGLLKFVIIILIIIIIIK